MSLQVNNNYTATKVVKYLQPFINSYNLEESFFVLLRGDTIS